MTLKKWDLRDILLAFSQLIEPNWKKNTHIYVCIYIVDFPGFHSDINTRKHKRGV